MTSAKELAERLEAEAVVIQQEIATGRMEPRATMIEAATRLRQMDKALAMLGSPYMGEHHTIKHDNFSGVVLSGYVTREGKRGVVMQQDGTRVVHVYGVKWLPSRARKARGE